MSVASQPWRGGAAVLHSVLCPVPGMAEEARIGSPETRAGLEMAPHAAPGVGRAVGRWSRRDRAWSLLLVP